MPDEFAVSGVPMRRQGEGLTGFVAALRAVWGPDPVHYDGPYYRVPSIDHVSLSIDAPIDTQLRTMAELGQHISRGAVSCAGPR